MDVQMRNIATAIAATLAIGFSVTAFAHENTDAVTTSGGDQPVRCDSNGKIPTFCGRDHVHYTIEAPSNPSCVEGKTWGNDDDRGVWVSGGCSGDFDGHVVTKQGGSRS